MNDEERYVWFPKGRTMKIIDKLEEEMRTNPDSVVRILNKNWEDMKQIMSQLNELRLVLSDFDTPSMELIPKVIEELQECYREPTDNFIKIPRNK